MRTDAGHVKWTYLVLRLNSFIIKSISQLNADAKRLKSTLKLTIKLSLPNNSIDAGAPLRSQLKPIQTIGSLKINRAGQYSKQC